MKISDSKLFYTFALIITLIGIITVSISLYSKFIYEDEILEKITSNNINVDLTGAYILLKRSSLFASYKGISEDNIYTAGVLKRLDKNFKSKHTITVSDRSELLILLMHRQKGTMLGIKSSVFLFALALLIFGMAQLSRSKERKILK